MRPIRISLITAIALAAAAGAGCQKHIQTPADFAVMDDPGPGFEYRAISSDEVVIGVQRKDNEPRGDAGFWMEVWKEKYPPIKDYSYVDHEEITTDGGLSGYLLEYTSEEQDGLYRMLVALFVQKKDIWIVSAGGADETLTEHRETLVEAFKTFKP
jgi:hypothetical protein